jgi:hypothetical protein
MSSRYMNVLISVFDKEKDALMGLVGGDPSTLAPKEFAKRLRLSFRDSPKGMPEEYEVAFIPFIVTLACASKYGISSPEAWDLLPNGKSIITGVEKFLLEMAAWQKMFKWLPSDRPRSSGLLSYDPKLFDSSGKEIEWNYGNTMGLVAEFYTTVLLRMAKASAEESRLLTTNNYSKIAERANSMPFMGKGALKRKVDGRIIPIK